MAATDKQLGELHRLVAESLTQALQEADAIEDPTDRAYAIKEARAQAITFLKNNSITADVTTDTALSSLREKLRARQRVPQAGLQEAAEAFAKSHGDMLQ